ncbi:serine/threonine-protein kinase dyf-5-like [Oratosquilla oratoria]|uniref:serine/threonine-protein kinase dyf-5-like n=1 Tax=Oratosquilla oratoria TaxID=337810 RepID=UPI003F75A405
MAVWLTGWQYGRLAGWQYRRLSDLMYDRQNREIASFRTLGRHPNAICLQEVIREEENHQVYFVLDIMDLSLEDTVKRMAEKVLSFTESEVKSVWFQCLKGLRLVHKVGLVHCDLAARNILVDRTGSVKITNFDIKVKGESIVQSLLTHLSVTKETLVN